LKKSEGGRERERREVRKRPGRLINWTET